MGRYGSPLAVNLPEHECCHSPPSSSVVNTTGNHKRNFPYCFLLTLPLNFQLVNANFLRYRQNVSEAKTLLHVNVWKASFHILQPTSQLKSSEQ